MILHKEGETIVQLFYTLVKAIQVYDIKNDVVQKTARKFIDYLNSLFASMPNVEIVRYRDYVFFNKQRLRFEIDGYASLQFLDSKLKTLRIKSLIFMPGIKEDEILNFSLVFKEEPDSFLKQYSTKKFEHIRIEFAPEEERIPEVIKDTGRVKRTYFRALKGLKNLMQNLWTNRPFDVRSSKRIVYSLIDSFFQDEFGLLAISTLKNFDEYTFNHSLNVGILSIALGHRLGLDKKCLTELGTAGLLHDLGKVEIPKKLIDKVVLTDEEWEIIKRHSIYGVREILKIRGLDEIAMISSAVAFQHHWNYDGSGYPTREKAEKPILFARVVRICDAYDAMTTERTYQPIPVLPHYALRVLWTYKNIWFDPTLVKVFTQLLGIYPVSSCLELSSGEIGLVMRQNRAYLDLPVVKIVIDREGKRIDGKTIDLSLQKQIKILRPIYPQKYGINPASYFV